MSQNSVAMVQSSLDLVRRGSAEPADRDCCLLDGDCKCYRPQKDCKYLGKEVFFGKKGGRLTKEMKLADLSKQIIACRNKEIKFENKREKLEKLFEEAEGKE